MSDLQLRFKSASASAGDIDACQVSIDAFRNESLVAQYRFLFNRYTIMALNPSNSDHEAVKSMLIEYSVARAQDLAGAGEFGGADTDSLDESNGETTGIETLDVRIETPDHAALGVFQSRAKKCEFRSFEKRAGSVHSRY